MNKYGEMKQVTRRFLDIDKYRLNINELETRADLLK